VEYEYEFAETSEEESKQLLSEPALVEYEEDERLDTSSLPLLEDDHLLVRAAVECPQVDCLFIQLPFGRREY